MAPAPADRVALIGRRRHTFGTIATPRLVALLFKRKDDTPRRSLWQRIKDVALTDVAVLARGGVDTGSLEQLEQLLLESDFGVPVTVRLVDEVRREARAAACGRRTSSSARSAGGSPMP
jgi:signal recognition particle GTPase